MTTVTRDRIGGMWQRFTGQRGGAVPNAARDILPVIVLDTPGAYPIGRTWFGGAVQAAVAANFSHIYIGNTDDPAVKKNSRVVIDGFLARLGGAQQLLIAVNTNVDSPYTFVQCEESSAGDNANPAAGASGRRPIGSVGIQALASLNSTAFFPIDVNDALIREYHIPLELGPGQTAVFQPGAVNAQLAVFAWGRYYEPT